VSLDAATMESISGTVELAGAQADTLLLPKDDSSSAVNAVASWCSAADGVICIVDGLEESVAAVNAQAPGKGLDFSELEKMRNAMMDAIKIAAQEATSSASKDGMKIAVLPADVDGDDEEGADKGNGGGLLSGFFGGGDVPASVTDAMKGNNLAILRYGELFGIPESSPEFSPFVGGPRKYPVFRDEYTMRAVRIDPSKTASGNTMLGENTRSSRLSVGEAAVRMANKSLGIKSGMDVSLTSLRGMQGPDDEEWAGEFNRVQETVEKSMGGELFSATFGSVPSVERLSNWIATKWAPAVLKTYDIAGIRVGARPVYASQTEEGKIEIVWQELKDFKTFLVGKMFIEINETGIVAKRGAGDANAGYGRVSSKPLAGEDILVRRLSEAATQAIDKGLATKPAPPKRRKKQVVEAPVVSTVVSAGAVDTLEPVQSKSVSSESGPRTSGARTERKRGGKRRREEKKD